MAFGDVLAGMAKASHEHEKTLLSMEHENRQTAAHYAMQMSQDPRFAPEQQQELAKNAFGFLTGDVKWKDFFDPKKNTLTLPVQLMPGTPQAPQQPQPGALPMGTPGAPLGMPAPQIAPPPAMPPVTEQRGLMQPMSPEEFARHQAYAKALEAGEVAKAQVPAKEELIKAQLPRYMMQQSQQLAKAGLKFAPNPNDPEGLPIIVPVEESELSAPQKAKMEFDKKRGELSDATIQLREAETEYKKSQVDPNSPMNKIRLGQLQMAQRRVAIAEGNLGLRNKEDIARYYGTDLQGNAIPGAPTDPRTGQSTGTAFARFVGPTAATLTRVQAAAPVVSQVNNLIDFAADPNNEHVFGIEGGLRKWAAGKIGTSDPALAGLGSKIESLSSFLTVLHGARGAALAKGFKETLRNIDSPEAFAQAVREYGEAAARVQEIQNKPAGTVKAPQPPGGQTAATAAAPTTSNMIRVQIPGHPPGTIPRSKLQQFLKDNPGAKQLQ